MIGASDARPRLGLSRGGLRRSDVPSFWRCHVPTFRRWDVGTFDLQPSTWNLQPV